MRYYLIIPDSDVYDHLRTLSENSDEQINQIIGNPLKNEWTPIPVALVKMKKRGDFPSMTGLVALSEKAWLILKPFIDKSVEALPLQSKEGTFFVINVLKRAKLNLSKSEVSRFSDGGIIRIQKYAFVKSSVSGKNIFIPEEIAYSKPIITEDLKKIIEENKLKGLIFKEIWDSEV